MAHQKSTRAGFLVLLRLLTCISVAPLVGCDSSTAVKTIPEASKKALIQRKVDVTPGQAKSSQTGSSRTKGRASGQKL